MEIVRQGEKAASRSRVDIEAERQCLGKVKGARQEGGARGPGQCCTA